MNKLLEIADGDYELAQIIGLKSIFIDDEYGLNLNKQDFKDFFNNNYSLMIKKIIANLLKGMSDIKIFDPFKTPLIVNLNGLYYVENPDETYEARFLINDINYSNDLKNNYNVVISDLTKVKGDIVSLVNKSINYSTSKIILNINNELIDEFFSHEYLKAVISLPIYENNNSSLLIFDLDKKYDECILIDESRFLKGFNNIKDWSFLSNEILEKINIPYFDFKESDNSIIIKKELKLNLTSKKRIGASDFNKENHNFTSVSGKDLNEILANKYVQNEKMNVNCQMYDKNMPNIENMLLKKDKPVINDDVEFLTLNQISNVKFYDETHDVSNSILMSNCFNEDSKWAFKPNEIKSSCNDFIEIEITSDKVIKDYLRAYLNSNKGLSEIDYFSNGYVSITPENVGCIRIPIPSINSQKRIVNAVNESNEFFKSIKYLKDEFQDNILDYEHIMRSVNEFKTPIKVEKGNVTQMNSNWRHVYDRLIWPLAITYLSATKGGYEKTDKASKYLILFEFVAAFNTIILLSGLPHDVYQKFKKTSIWNAPYLTMYRDMTFGNWMYLYRSLSKIYCFNEFSTGFDKKLFDELSDKKIVDMLDETREIRNRHSHGSMISHKEAELLLEDLNSYLTDVFNILEIYSNYKLFYTTGHFKKSDDIYTHRVILLNGPCKQPIFGSMNFNKDLKEESLYLYNPSNNNLLLLDDKLIKFRAVDKYEKQWGIYLFNGYTDDKKIITARYKYFQENEEDYVEEINSFEEDIIR